MGRLRNAENALEKANATVEKLQGELAQIKREREPKPQPTTNQMESRGTPKQSDSEYDDPLDKVDQAAPEYHQGF